MLLTSKLLSLSFRYLRVGGKQAGFSHSPPLLRGGSMHMFLLVQRDRTVCCCLCPPQLGSALQFRWDPKEFLGWWDVPNPGAYTCHGQLGLLVSEQPRPEVLHQHKHFKCPCQIRITFPGISLELPKAFTVTQTLWNDACR